MAAKIKKGDKVVVLAGKDKGKTGTVERVIPERHQGCRRGDQPRSPPHQAVGEPGRGHLHQGRADPSEQPRR